MSHGRPFDNWLYAHFITFSCCRRRRLIDHDQANRILLGVLNSEIERLTARCVGFVVIVGLTASTASVALERYGATFATSHHDNIELALFFDVRRQNQQPPTGRRQIGRLGEARIRRRC